MPGDQSVHPEGKDVTEEGEIQRQGSWHRTRSINPRSPVALGVGAGRERAGCVPVFTGEPANAPQHDSRSIDYTL